MSVTPIIPAPRDLDAEQQRDIERFERAVAQYLVGRDQRRRLPGVPPEQRHLRPAPGRHQPDGARSRCPTASITPEQLDLMGHLAETYSRGLGPHHHPPEHPVPLRRARPRCPTCMRELGAGRADHPRGVRRHRPQRAWPATSPAPARSSSSTSPRGPRPRSGTSCATRSPSACPRKFKINFSGCATDCGQAMFNDVGVIATTRTLDDGSTETGLPRVHRRWPRRQPAPGARPRGVHLPRRPAADHRVGAAGVRPDRQPRQQAARPHEVGRRPAGHRRGAGAASSKMRHFLLASSSWPGGIPEIVQKAGDAPAGVATHDRRRPPIGQGTPCRSRRADPYERWVATNVVRGAANGTVSAVAYAALGDITVRPVPGAGLDPARARRRRAAHQPPERRVPRPRPRTSCPCCTPASTPSAWPEPGAELARDVVACPGADTCNLAVTQSRGLADAIGERARGRGPGRGRRRAHQHLRLHQLAAASTTPADIGFFGAERRAHGQAAPGYQMLLGGYVGQEQIHFGEKALRLPAKARARGRRAGRPPVRRRAQAPARPSATGWIARAAPAAIADELEGPRLLPVARRSARVLRRLRRDRAVRGRGRRVGVRSLSARYDAAVAAIDAANERGSERRRGARPTNCRWRWPTDSSPPSGSGGSSTSRTRRCCSRRVPTTCAAGRCAATATRPVAPATCAGEGIRRLATRPTSPGSWRRAATSPARSSVCKRLMRRENVDGAQAVEDAACLVFIETQLGSLAARMEHDLMIEVIRKTARKMSQAGIADGRVHTSFHRRRCPARRGNWR